MKRTIGAQHRLLGLGIAMAAFAAGCSGALPGEDVSSNVEQPLYLTGAQFPGREVPVCWTSSSVARSDFSTWSVRTTAAVARSWTQATGLRFSGWGTCPANPVNTVSVNLTDTGAANSTVGFVSGGTTVMNLGVLRSDFDTATMHEFGHALGYAHEMDRPDFIDDPSGSCMEGNISGGNTLDTPADRNSIMASTGYCQNNLVLDAWDVIGAQTSYGRPDYLVDVTGNGRADAVVVNPTGVFVRTSNGSSFPSATLSNWTGVPFFGQKGTAFADVNGDGRADVIAVNDTGVFIRTSNGSSFPASSQAQWTNAAYYGDRGTFFADVTGDGKADAIAVNPGGISVRTSNGSSFPANTQSLWLGTFIGDLGNFFADVNGDGRADAIAVNTGGVLVALSSGSSFGTPTNWTSIGFFGDRGTFFADVTGDGKADAIVVNTNGVTVRRSNGSSFNPNEIWTTDPYYGERGTLFADVNGGGRADAIAVNEAGVFVRPSSGSAFSAPAVNWTGGAFYGLR